MSGTAEYRREERRKAKNATPGSALGEQEPRHPGLKIMGRNKKKKRDNDSRRPRLILSFDEEKRR